MARTAGSTGLPEGRLALAAPHKEAADAGREAFVDGGNAVDAALAACATLAVVYPHMCGLGGDLIALLHAPDGTVTVVNASGAAPAALTRDVVAAELERLAAEIGPDTPAAEPSPHGMPVRGPHTVTVPGTLSGWAALCEMGGALEWGRILRPAIERAANGTSVSRGLAAMFAEAPALVLDDPGLRAVFAPHGRLPVEGDLVRQPALAASLKILVHDGVEAFYHGPLGAAFVAGLRAAGSLMTVEDLAAHEPELAAPLALEAFGHEFMTAPPNSQGFVLLEMLGALQRLVTLQTSEQIEAGRGTRLSHILPLDPLGPDAGALAQLFSLASADRDAHLCDPRFRTVPLDRLLSAAHLDALAEQARALPQGQSSRDHSTPSGDTIACVAADSDGWAVSIIQSLYYGFGSGILEPATGIVAHDRGACFSLDPASPNLIQGGKRPLHTLMPLLVKRDGRLAVVAGTMGGEAQPQIHTQILSRLLRDRSDVPSAIAAPRFIWDEGVLAAEKDVPDACREALQASGLPLSTLGRLSDSVGHAQYVRIHEDGRLEAGSDPRADGEAVLAERP